MRCAKYYFAEMTPRSAFNCSNRPKKTVPVLEPNGKSAPSKKPISSYPNRKCRRSDTHRAREREMAFQTSALLVGKCLKILGAAARKSQWVLTGGGGMKRLYQGADCTAGGGDKRKTLSVWYTQKQIATCGSHTDWMTNPVGRSVGPSVGPTYRNRSGGIGRVMWDVLTVATNRSRFSLVVGWQTVTAKRSDMKIRLAGTFHAKPDEPGKWEVLPAWCGGGKSCLFQYPHIQHPTHAIACVRYKNMGNAWMCVIFFPVLAWHDKNRKCVQQNSPRECGVRKGRINKTLLLYDVYDYFTMSC